jgi:hypothetical protein
MKEKEKVVRPGGFQLPTFWFVANGVKMLNALFGVAYGLETPFFPHLAAPNLAPKTNYIELTVYVIGSSRKAKFGLGERILNHRPASQEQ